MWAALWRQARTRLAGGEPIAKTSRWDGSDPVCAYSLTRPDYCHYCHERRRSADGESPVAARTVREKWKTV